MAQPPEATGRRALIAAVWLVCAFAGLVGAVWAVGWALAPGPPPSLATVAEATRLHYPDSTEVVDADLAQMHAPAPGSTGAVTVAVPAGDFGDFIAGNDMGVPLLSGATPSGAATGLIRAGCTGEVCYAGTFVVEDGTVTVELRVTLL